MTAVKNGKSFAFYGHRYPGSNIPLKIGDRVLISNKYTAVVTSRHVMSVMAGAALQFEISNELVLRGTKQNSGWEGKVIDQFEFDRLTFVGR